MRDEAHCSFVMGKARVTPLKHVTLMRLELAAATVSTRTSEFLRAELSYQKIQEYFWTDSKIVLGYVPNDARRFHVYVANRVQQIRDSSDPNSWQYVDTSCNPADEASRGLMVKQLVEKSCWLTGPEFLQMDGPTVTPKVAAQKLDEADPEVKQAAVLSTCTEATNENQFPDYFEKCRLDRFSTWHRAKRAIANCLRYKTRLRQGKVVNGYKVPVVAVHPPHVSVEEMEEAETEILKSLQLQHFKSEVQALQQVKQRVSSQAESQ
ncbi:uncharacterized protein LOC110990628 [Acanthaster planci]|uniref:Uncharacterized protein LOC110990628 n=1 Tax=Acanthaster planci TaxID=133434 RepID=A0A8B8A214_ACAPL|nr:uncharacterized protein LOC110990628 [Acanthaster planci]